MSAGTAYQLFARGPQDLKIGDLSKDLETFTHTPVKPLPSWKYVETVGVTLESGKRHIIDVPHAGDLFVGAVLEVTLPPGIVWVPDVQYALFQRIKFVIDDAVVVDHERLWYHIHASYQRKQIPDTPNQCVYVPLLLGVGRDAPLPLTGLANARVQIVIQCETFDNIVQNGAAVSWLSAAVLCDFVLVGDAERVALPTVIPYVTCKDCEAEGSLGVVHSVDLSRITLPAASVYWVAYTEPVTRYFDYVDIVSAELAFGPDVLVKNRQAGYFKNVQGLGLPRVSAEKVYAYLFGDRVPGVLPMYVYFPAVKRPVLRVTMGAVGFKVKVFAECVNYLCIGGGSARVGL